MASRRLTHEKVPFVHLPALLIIGLLARCSNFLQSVCIEILFCRRFFCLFCFCKLGLIVSGLKNYNFLNDLQSYWTKRSHLFVNGNWGHTLFLKSEELTNPEVFLKFDTNCLMVKYDCTDTLFVVYIFIIIIYYSFILLQNYVFDYRVGASVIYCAYTMLFLLKSKKQSLTSETSVSKNFRQGIVNLHDFMSHARIFRMRVFFHNSPE